MLHNFRFELQVYFDEKRGRSERFERCEVELFLLNRIRIAMHTVSCFHDFPFEFGTVEPGWSQSKGSEPSPLDL